MEGLEITRARAFSVFLGLMWRLFVGAFFLAIFYLILVVSLGWIGQQTHLSMEIPYEIVRALAWVTQAVVLFFSLHLALRQRYTEFQIVLLPNPPKA